MKIRTTTRWRAATGLLGIALAAGSLATTTAATAAPTSSAAAPAAASSAQLHGKLAMTGDVGDYRQTPAGVVDDPVHDPTLFEAGGVYYVFSTGRADPDDPGGIYARRSTGTLAGPWESMGEIALPEWTRAYGVAHLWAPMVAERAGTYYLYYAASSFGTNDSAIGLATTRTPGDLSSWVDQGPILTSRTGDDFNAIDPDVYFAKGRWWIAYGSFWTGIKVRELVDMRTPTGPVTSLASNEVDPPNAIENPQVFQHGKYWYLTASIDFCCRGVDSTYKTVVGRSTSPTGPFLDRDGTPMTEGATTVLLASRGNQVGTGALDVLSDRGRLWAVHHYYDASTGGTIRMQVREVEWTADGWPTFSYGPGDGAPPA